MTGSLRLCFTQLGQPVVSSSTMFMWGCQKTLLPDQNLIYRTLILILVKIQKMYWQLKLSAGEIHIFLRTRTNGGFQNTSKC